MALGAWEGYDAQKTFELSSWMFPSRGNLPRWTMHLPPATEFEVAREEFSGLRVFEELPHLRVLGLTNAIRIDPVALTGNARRLSPTRTDTQSSVRTGHACVSRRPGCFGIAL